MVNEIINGNLYWLIHGVTLRPLFRPGKLEFRNVRLVFVEGGERENPATIPRNRNELQQQTQPTYGVVNSGNRTQATLVGGERSHHCASPAPLNSYTFFDGFTDNTRGYFTSCEIFFRAPQGRGKMRATSKMSARIICKTIE